MSSEGSPLVEFDPEEQEVAEQLSEQRPVPGAGFRGALRRHLDERDPGWGPRPRQLRLISAAYLSAGTILIVLGALIATGHP